MKLIPLFDGELRFDETTEVAFPSHGQDGDWLGYVEGDGAVSGERLAGELRWTNHPRRRADGTWLPRFEGAIKTDDSAEILFAIQGAAVNNSGSQVPAYFGPKGDCTVVGSCGQGFLSLREDFVIFVRPTIL